MQAVQGWGVEGGDGYPGHTEHIMSNTQTLGAAAGPLSRKGLTLLIVVSEEVEDKSREIVG